MSGARDNFDFDARTPLGGDSATVLFDGRFEGRAVRWQVRLVTLARWAREQGHRGPLRNFIDIGAPGAGAVPVTIGLAVTRIDRPTVLKAMVMLRQYKRLRHGRHEYGEPVCVDAGSGD